MTCDCEQLIHLSLGRARSQARTSESEYGTRLERFRDGIREGAREIAARHLYRAGVYLSSLDNELARNPSLGLVLVSLTGRLSETNSKLWKFLKENQKRVEEQPSSVEPRKILRNIIRLKNKAPGLLEAHALRELDQATASLDRVKRMDGYLASWKESLRLEVRPKIAMITDMHSDHGSDIVS